MLNGVLWVLRTGARWRELPEKYPPFQTCHRRFQQRIRSGKLEGALRLLARMLHEQGKLNLEEAFVDATFASAKKEASQLTQHGGARARRLSLSRLTTVFLSPYLSRAFRLPECKFVDEVLAGSFLDELPVRLIGDKAYDSAELDRQLKNEYGVEMIAPNRCTAAKHRTGENFVATKSDGR